jgi:hypothetical protein
VTSISKAIPAMTASATTISATTISVVAGCEAAEAGTVQETTISIVMIPSQISLGCSTTTHSFCCCAAAKRPPSHQHRRASSRNLHRRAGATPCCLAQCRVAGTASIASRELLIPSRFPLTSCRLVHPRFSVQKVSSAAWVPAPPPDSASTS